MLPPSSSEWIAEEEMQSIFLNLVAMEWPFDRNFYFRNRLGCIELYAYRVAISARWEHTRCWPVLYGGVKRRKSCRPKLIIGEQAGLASRRQRGDARLVVAGDAVEVGIWCWSVESPRLQKQESPLQLPAKLYGMSKKCKPDCPDQLRHQPIL